MTKLELFAKARNRAKVRSRGMADRENKLLFVVAEESRKDAELFN